MKNKVFGWIAIVWGGLIILSGVVKFFSGNIGGGDYGAGQWTGFIFGGILLIVGVLALRKSS